MSKLEKLLMNNINSSSLFHFTKTFGRLQNILKKGLRYSYSLEAMFSDVEFNEIAGLGDLETLDKHVAIPMICFCDIPLMRTRMHSMKYGNYIIGLDKDFITSLYAPILNPILYANSENVQKLIFDLTELKEELFERQMCLSFELAEKSLSEKLEEVEKLKSELKNLIHRKISADFLIGLSKPYQKRDEKGQFDCYYDEREWRSILLDGMIDFIEWKRGITPKTFFDNKNGWNKEIGKSKDGYMSIPSGFLYLAITHIVVSKDNQIEKMIDLIMTSKSIFGCRDVSQRERLLLVSKITSMERLKLDY